MPDDQPVASPSTAPAALVTGATSGIGREFAEQLAARGHDLVLVARDRDRLASVAADLERDRGVSVEVLSADLTDRAQLGRVEDRLRAEANPIGVLVNNAGFGLKKSFADNSLEQEQAHLDVLVVAPMRLTHVAVVAMAARGGGQIVNVSSVAGFIPRGSYGAAKAYLTRLSTWAHREYADRGVQVMALCPGFVRTEFHGRMEVSRSSVPRPLWFDADRLVREALADLDAGKALSVPTKRYRAIVAATGVVPDGLLQRLERMGRR